MNGTCTGVPVYLAPWTACPPGGKPTAVGLPPGGQAVPGYLAPHPGYLHPRLLGEGSKIKFSEHGHVAYQIKGDEQ